MVTQSAEDRRGQGSAGNRERMVAILTLGAAVVLGTLSLPQRMGGGDGHHLQRERDRINRQVRVLKEDTVYLPTFHLFATMPANSSSVLHTSP